jgi:hypothetical protein
MAGACLLGQSSVVLGHSVLLDAVRCAPGVEAPVARDVREQALGWLVFARSIESHEPFQWDWSFLFRFGWGVRSLSPHALAAATQHELGCARVGPSAAPHLKLVSRRWLLDVLGTARFRRLAPCVKLRHASAF